MTKQINILVISILVIFTPISNFSCADTSSNIDTKYKYINPDYNLVHLNHSSDTLRFELDQSTYNSIKTFNTFTDKNNEFISFFDVRSSSLNIYRLSTQKLEKKISVTDYFKKKKLYRPTIYVKNFDSIFITNYSTLYIVDSSGLIKTSFNFLEDENTIYATFENITPPVYINGNLITGIRPYVADNSLKALREWKVLYEFNFNEQKATLNYNLPNIYRNNYYGYHFLDFGYCYNNRGNFVFSFPADSTIYESNLKDYHVAYFAKSFQHNSPVKPLTKKQVSDKDTSFKLYMIQDSYGPIYFDSFRKRYLRVFKPKISELAFDSKQRNRQNRFIIFNEQLQIIGESPIPDEVLYNSLFFTGDGKMFMRINAADEYALHFVRMEYQDLKNQAIQLTRANTKPDK